MNNNKFEKGLPVKVEKVDGSNLRILIIHARWNEGIISNLKQGAIDTLVNVHNVQSSNIVIKEVPGAYELPFACKKLIQLSQKHDEHPFDAVIAIGVLIKGSTMHFEYICEAVTQGITNVALQTNVPVIFGVLTCLSDEQAIQRSDDNVGHNHGKDWGSAAVEMSLLGL
ncbi:dimethylribityllumazine synthase [Neoconidiobolus thromboides FSU 785]|nr:dimethylribityllumazine synthase [Neoconidiobolus thromboides FSU 785]